MRPREHYTCHGPAELGDTELLALLLGTGAGGQTALGIAADLLARFDGLAGVARAEPGALQAVPGVGPARAVRVHAALEAGRRVDRRRRDLPDRANTPEEAYQRFHPGFRGLAHEELHALYLDRRHRIVAHRVLTRGSDSLTVVDPRQVYRPAVSLNAAAVLLAHNHPSGDPTPSAMDREVTRRVARGGQVLGIPLIDHLVIGASSYRSLAEEGVITPAASPWTTVSTGP